MVCASVGSANNNNIFVGRTGYLKNTIPIGPEQVVTTLRFGQAHTADKYDA